MTAVPVGLSVRAISERGDFRLDVEFKAAPGEVVGVLGPNGAGKTTLLRALAGLIALGEGHIALDGQVFDDVEAGVFVAANKRPVGLVFQNYLLFPHLSVRENIAFAPRCQRLGKLDAHAVADEWVERLGLRDLAARKPAGLSGGQAQRVALARALAAAPGMLLLDEPLAALDARTRLEVRGELRRHLADFAGPTLLITHDPLDAMVLTDRILVIESGRIVQQGTPAEIARRPATTYVARLVGLNLYQGSLAGTQIELVGGGTMHASASSQDRAPVLVAVRPSAITVHASRPAHASPRNIWPGTIDGLESLADRVRLQVTGTPSALVDVTPAAVAELGLSYGMQVWLSAKATDIDVYADPNA